MEEGPGRERRETKEQKFDKFLSKPEYARVRAPCSILDCMCCCLHMVEVAGSEDFLLDLRGNAPP